MKTPIETLKRFCHQYRVVEDSVRWWKDGLRLGHTRTLELASGDMLGVIIDWNGEYGNDLVCEDDAGELAQRFVESIRV